MTSSRWRMSASRAYELSPDLREKQVEMLCRKYGGPTLASHAARVIQHAYRRYRLSRSFARMRLEAAASPGTAQVDKRLSRCFADVDSPPIREAAAPARTVSGICCRVRPRDVQVADPDTVQWTVAERRRQVAVQKSHSVSVTSTTASRHHHHHHHHRVVVRAGCCTSPDTSSVTSCDDGPARPAVGIVVQRHERRTLPVTTFIVPPSISGSRSDDELLCDAMPRTTSNLDDPDQLTDVDEVHLGEEDQPNTSTTFQQLCLTDSSYGEMTNNEADSDTDDTQPHYVDGEALEAVVAPRTHVYSSLRLCNSRHTVVTLPGQSRDEMVASNSPIWKRKDVDGSCEDSKETTMRCVGCGRRGQSAPQLSEVATVMPPAPSESAGSLADIGN